MNKTKTDIIDGIEIDVEKALRILLRILEKEKSNIKTKQYNAPEMARQIKHLIEEEVQCY